MIIENVMENKKKNGTILKLYWIFVSKMLVANRIVFFNIITAAKKWKLK